MVKSTKVRSEAARFCGLLQLVRYPVGRADLEYQFVHEAGRLGDEVHTLKLILTDDEARQLSRHFAELADKISAAGGTKQ